MIPMTLLRLERPNEQCRHILCEGRQNNSTVMPFRLRLVFGRNNSCSIVMIVDYAVFMSTYLQNHLPSRAPRLTNS